MALLLGAHMSIVGGLDKAIEAGENIGCTAIQIFTKSNRQWSAKAITDEAATLFRTKLTNSNIGYVNVHASYLINVASLQKDVAEKSTQALITELKRCSLLGIQHLVLHPGSHRDGDKVKSLKIAAKNIDRALAETKKTRILLETMAGQGSNIGKSFEELAQLYELIENKSRIQFCFDTCHVFAAGYDIRTKATYQHTMAQFDATLGLNNLALIHLNDSKTALGSNKDRHEHIGKGKIGLEAFSLIMNDPTLKRIPKILETPKEKDPKEDVENLTILTSLVTQRSV